MILCTLHTYLLNSHVNGDEGSTTPQPSTMRKEGGREERMSISTTNPHELTIAMDVTIADDIQSQPNILDWELLFSTYTYS